MCLCAILVSRVSGAFVLCEHLEPSPKGVLHFVPSFCYLQVFDSILTLHKHWVFLQWALSQVPLPSFCCCGSSFDGPTSPSDIDRIVADFAGSGY